MNKVLQVTTKVYKNALQASEVLQPYFKESKGCRKPPRYVPYKGTYVLYDGTYGVPDQGQTLDV